MAGDSKHQSRNISNREQKNNEKNNETRLFFEKINRHLARLTKKKKRTQINKITCERETLQ